MVVRTNYFYGLELDKVNEVYVIPEPVCYRTIYIHPDVVKNNGEIDFPNKPIVNCDIVEINYFKALMVVPGEYILRVFDTDGGDIEGTSGRVKSYAEETYNGKFIKTMILGKKDQPIKIEWTDKEGNRFITTIYNIETGEMETVLNPEPVEVTEDED